MLDVRETLLFLFLLYRFFAHYTDVLAHLIINYKRLGTFYCQIRVNLPAYLLAYVHSCTFDTLVCS
jgi:hypothetical protein